MSYTTIFSLEQVEAHRHDLAKLAGPRHAARPRRLARRLRSRAAR